MNTARGRRGLLLPLTLVPVAALLSACGPAGTGTSTQPTTAPPQAVQTPSSPAATAGPSRAASPATQTSGRRCHAEQLEAVVTADPGGGAAGSYGLRIVFTNTGASACTMYGFPGVSFVTGARGYQVNSPAKRASATPSTLTLAPGGSAHALVLMVNPGNYPADACHPVTVGGFRIYPPDEVTPLYAAFKQQVCSTTGTGVATVYPVTS